MPTKPETQPELPDSATETKAANVKAPKDGDRVEVHYLENPNAILASAPATVRGKADKLTLEVVELERPDKRGALKLYHVPHRSTSSARPFWD